MPSSVFCFLCTPVHPLLRPQSSPVSSSFLWSGLGSLSVPHSVPSHIPPPSWSPSSGTPLTRASRSHRARWGGLGWVAGQLALLTPPAEPHRSDFLPMDPCKTSECAPRPAPDGQTQETTQPSMGNTEMGCVQKP